MKMSKVQMLRALVNQRQTAAAEEVFELFERSTADYRDVCLSRGDRDRQREVPEADLSASVVSLRAEVQQVVVGEQVPAEQQKWGPRVDQADPGPPRIKEEQEEELWSSREGEQLRGPVPAEGEDGDERAPRPPQLRRGRADGRTEAEAGGEGRGVPEPSGKLRVLVKLRLSAAVEEIFGLFEATLAEYEEEIDGLRKLLEEAVKLEVQIHTADVPQLLVIKEEVPSEQQEWRTGLSQADREPPHIKEEREEELWSSREAEQLQGREGDDITEIPVTAVPVKSEDDEGKARSSQLHQGQTDERMETARIFGPACALQQESDDKTYSSDHDTENSDDYSQEMSRPQSGLVTLNHNEDSVSHKDSNPVEKLCGGKTVNGVPNMRVDTGGKLLRCSICGKGFSENSDLKRHIRFHTGEKPFSCVFCEKHFTEKADLKRHTRVHTGEKPFSCPVCGRGFSEKTDLTRHIRVHTGEKPFSCSICGKIFSQNENLRRHERIHTGEKPFSCPVCTKKFTHRGALVVHMRIHTGEKPFGCSVCGKRYIETGNLKKHMIVHTGEKPFSCSVCGRRFNYQSQVKNHKCSGESSVTIVHHS